MMSVLQELGQVLVSTWDIETLLMVIQKYRMGIFSCLAEFNVMKSQPLLSRVEIIGKLLSKELISTSKCDLSVGLYLSVF